MNSKVDALAFFDACETGQGWQACAQYCTPDATFSAQADALIGVNTLQAYADWMTGIIAVMPDARYEILAFGFDEERNSIAAAAIFHATHTGKGGPFPPTGQSVSSHYCYFLRLEEGKIAAMTKIWNDVHALRALGWT